MTLVVLARSPIASALHAPRGSWWVTYSRLCLDGDEDAPDLSRPWVSIKCQDCGADGMLRSAPGHPRSDGTRGHEITPDGTVSPSIVCPNPECHWHVWGRLDRWEPLP